MFLCLELQPQEICSKFLAAFRNSGAGQYILWTHLPIAFGAALFALFLAGGTAPGEDDDTPEPREVVVPIIGKLNMPEMKLEIPTGSEEFTVLSPAPTSLETVSVEKFGASPGNADNTKAFNDAIAYCASSHAAKLVVPKGVYRFTQGDSVTFNKLADFEFDGQGSTFIYNHPRGHFMLINHCERVLFKDFSVDWDWDNNPIASVVKLEAVEPSGAYADFRFVDYERFPKRDVILEQSFAALDPVTLSVGYAGGGGCWLGGDGVNPKTEWLSDNLIRVYASDSVESMSRKVFVSNFLNAKGGFYRVMHMQRNDGAINTGNNVNLTLSGVNIYSCPGSAIYAWGDQHHWQVLNTNVMRPPGTKRPISSLADSLDVAQTLGYFKMDGCEIGYGGDDCFCVIGGGTIGTKTGEHTIKARGLQNPDHFRVGDPVEIRQDDYSPTGFTGKILQIKTIGQATNGIREFTFEQVLPEPNGRVFVLFNRHYTPKNIIIRNCYFHDNQARGALLKGENITLENTRFYHNELGAIHIYSGYRYKDGADGCGADNIVIRNNHIDTPDPEKFYEASKMPAIYVFTYIRACQSEAPQCPEDKSPYPLLRNILIEKNEFVNCPGVIASVCSAKNVIIRDNLTEVTRSGTGNQPYRGSIEVGFASDVFILGNKWNISPDMSNPGIIMDSKTIRNLFWKDNAIND